MDAVQVMVFVALVVIAFLAAALAFTIAWLRRERAAHQALMEHARTLDSRKRSQATRYGQITEQFAPFMADWPWDPKRFKFIGDPIDGIQFTDQGIIFVEIKTNTSRLSPVQVQARDHVAAGRIYWTEHRIG